MDKPDCRANAPVSPGLQPGWIPLVGSKSTGQKGHPARLRLQAHHRPPGQFVRCPVHDITIVTIRIEYGCGRFSPATMIHMNLARRQCEARTDPPIVSIAFVLLQLMHV
eukprot:6720942-Pyramimonas_sp.AAC.1